MTAKQHFGYSPQDAGEKAAKDVADGKISPKDVADQYGAAKAADAGDDFKKGYAKGAKRTFDKNK
jgi:hypothetical protein